jgi:hypothetical protein
MSAQCGMHATETQEHIRLDSCAGCRRCNSVDIEDARCTWSPKRDRLILKENKP